MCGSGTFVIEAAEIAAGLAPGRSRHFAFEQLATFDPAAWQKIRAAENAVTPAVRFYGSDHDRGAIRMSRANAERAGVAGFTEFEERAIEDAAPPAGPPGLVIVNPPYGDRIGSKAPLRSLYRALGHTLLTCFSGWRVGLITNEPSLAQATGLPFALEAEPVLHGGMRIALYRTAPLP
jgi:putative N6-adenine-specific DNA methylase